MIPEDILLLRLLKSSDKTAYKYLFDSYFEALCRYVFLYLKNKQEAEEIVMDIFLYLWENREKIEIKLSFKAYLFQAARNRCLNTLRDRKEVLSLEDIAQNASPQADVFNALETQELRELIEEAILSLPNKCREVFLKSRQDNMTNQEIATDMAISVKTVEAQITKALKKIKGFLGSKYTYLF